MCLETNDIRTHEVVDDDQQARHYVSWPGCVLNGAQLPSIFNAVSCKRKFLVVRGDGRKVQCQITGSWLLGAKVRDVLQRMQARKSCPLILVYLCFRPYSWQAAPLRLQGSSRRMPVCFVGRVFLILSLNAGRFRDVATCSLTAVSLPAHSLNNLCVLVRPADV